MIRRGRVFPILVAGAERKDGEADFKVLAEVSANKGKAPIALRQITVLESQTKWTTQEARNHLVNESSLSLRKVILNTHNLHNPIKRWNDAVWFHRWVEDGLGASHCVIMVIIPITPKELSLLKPERSDGIVSTRRYVNSYSVPRRWVILCALKNPWPS